MPPTPACRSKYAVMLMAFARSHAPPAHIQLAESKKEKKNSATARVSFGRQLPRADAATKGAPSDQHPSNNSEEDGSDSVSQSLYSIRCDFCLINYFFKVIASSIILIIFIL